MVMWIFWANFATAKVIFFRGMEVKKTPFLFIFLLLASFVFAQTPNSQKKTSEKSFYVQIETDFGNMVVKLYNETPLHRDNFLKLVKDGIFDSLLFHRVIQNFMIQGGDPDSKNAKPGQMLGEGGLGYTVPAEFVSGLFHKKGALAAARQGDEVNPRKESSASQFYIVQGNVWNADRLRMVEQRYGKTFTREEAEVYATLGGTPFLDGDYTVFGEVVEGLEVVDKIAAVRCGTMDRPLQDVRMKMKIIEK